MGAYSFGKGKYKIMFQDLISHKIIIMNVLHEVFDNRQLFADTVKSLKISKKCFL